MTAGECAMVSQLQEHLRMMTDVNCGSDKGELKSEICEIHEAVAREWKKFSLDRGRFVRVRLGTKTGF